MFQFGIRIWGGTTENAIKSLQLQQNKIIRIYLGKDNSLGSTLNDYNELGVLQVKLIYKKMGYKKYNHLV